MTGGRGQARGEGGEGVGWAGVRSEVDSEGKGGKEKD